MSFGVLLLLLVGVLLVLLIVVGVLARRLKFMLPVAVAVTLVAGWWAWSDLGESPHLVSVEEDGSHGLRVTYLGASCEDHRHVSVEETASKIEIAVTTRSFASSCDDAAVRRSFMVKLEEPLGSRRIIDANSASQIPLR